MKIKYIITALFLAAVFLLPVSLNAQSDGFFRGGANDNYENRDDNVTTGGMTTGDFTTPLGSGLLIMVAAGAGYVVVRRKRARKCNTLLLAFVLLLTFTQCKKKIETINSTNADKVYVTFSTTSGAKTGITEAGHVTWTEGDKLYVYGSIDGYLGYLTLNSFIGEGQVEASFKGYLEPWDGSGNNQTFHFYYVGDNVPVSYSKYKHADLRIDFSDQSYSGIQSPGNDLTNIANHYHVMRCSVSNVLPYNNYSGSFVSFSGHMTNMISIGVFNTNDFSDATTSTSNVKMYAESGLKNLITISATDGSLSYGYAGINSKTGYDNQSGHIITGPASAKRYIAMLPDEEDTPAVVNLMFTSQGWKTNTALPVTITRNAFVENSNKSVITPSSPIPVSTDKYVDLAVISKSNNDVALFTVASGKKIQFAKGNLVYDEGRFKMHKKQYGRCYSLNNSDVSGDYKVSGTFDLFGWGTSGWNNGNLLYMPYTISDDQTDPYYSNTAPGPENKNAYGYGPGRLINGSYVYGFSYPYEYADWGICQFGMKSSENSNNWRTLTKAEWLHLINSRSNARYAKATVCGVMGLIIFPDNTTVSSGSVSLGGVTISGVNVANTKAEINTINETNWNTLEGYGVVFLPFAGVRTNSSVVVERNSSTDVALAYYWSSTYNTEASGVYENYADCLYFNDNTKPNGSSIIAPGNNHFRYRGHAVRLVKDN